jgi:hypothetical protein
MLDANMEQHTSDLAADERNFMLSPRLWIWNMIPDRI